MNPKAQVGWLALDCNQKDEKYYPGLLLFPVIDVESQGQKVKLLENITIHLLLPV